MHGRSRVSEESSRFRTSAACITVMNALQRNAMPANAFLANDTLPEAGPYRYVILDRDAKFDATIITFLKATGLRPKRTSIQSPWQNGTAERWVGSCLWRIAQLA
jgi:hypothetical protein